MRVCDFYARVYTVAFSTQITQQCDIIGKQHLCLFTIGIFKMIPTYIFGFCMGMILAG